MRNRYLNRMMKERITSHSDKSTQHKEKTTQCRGFKCSSILQHRKLNCKTTALKSNIQFQFKIQC